MYITYVDKINVYIHVYRHLRTYICMYVSMYICMYMCMYAQTHIFKYNISYYGMTMKYVTVSAKSLHISVFYMQMNVKHP